MGEWRNFGDVDPKQGTFMVRNARIEDGNFMADSIVVIPESDVGGSDRVFDIGAGDLFLGCEKFASALATVGARLDGSVIIRPGLEGREDRIEPGTREYLDELAYAANAYCGPEYDYSTLVGIGIPTPYDQSSKFDGEVELFAEGTSLWSIIKTVTDGFDYKVDGEDIQSARPLDLLEGPYAGTPRDITSMKDLVKIKAFADCGKDEQGNPLVWQHEYVIPDGEEGTELVLSAHEQDSYMFEGEEILPKATKWVGPKQEDLCEAWERLYVDTRQPELSDDDPYPDM
jgi:hypothetical protein